MSPHVWGGREKKIESRFARNKLEVWENRDRHFRQIYDHKDRHPELSSDSFQGYLRVTIRPVRRVRGVSKSRGSDRVGPGRFSRCSGYYGSGRVRVTRLDPRESAPWAARVHPTREKPWPYQKNRSPLISETIAITGISFFSELISR